MVGFNCSYFLFKYTIIFIFRRGLSLTSTSMDGFLCVSCGIQQTQIHENKANHYMKMCSKVFLMDIFTIHNMAAMTSFVARFLALQPPWEASHVLFGFVFVCFHSWWPVEYHLLKLHVYSLNILYWSNETWFFLFKF